MSHSTPEPSASGPSSLRTRLPPALSQSQTPNTIRSSTLAGDNADGYDLAVPPSASSGGGPSTGASSNVYFPGGLPLPAVKGVISGIESPRHHRGSPSVGSRRDLQSTPMTPTTASTVRTFSVQPQPSPQPSAEDDLVEQPYKPRIAFRADPTLKSTFLGLRMEKKDEICRLFGVI